MLLFFFKNDPPEVGERIVEITPRAVPKIIEGGDTRWLTGSKDIAPILSRFLLQIETENG